MSTKSLHSLRGDRLAKVVTNRSGVSGVSSRRVLAVERSYPRSLIVVYTRKRPTRPCRCTRAEWRQWAKHASITAK